jgi:phytanoyl-CoA hydroxylase
MGKQDILRRELFDEVAYTQHYDDIRKALNAGEIESGWWHYDNFGRAEGREAFPVDTRFDSKFYLRAYPIVNTEIRARKAKTPHEHYLKFGKGRGFLPYPNAPRSGNTPDLSPAFEGFWPDADNAKDILAGKLEIGQVSGKQAALLSSWIDDGYVVLEQAIPSTLIDAAVSDVDKAYAGGFPKLRFECHKVQSEGLIPWQPEVASHPAKAIDLHHFSPAARDVMFAEAISNFLGTIFESNVFASNSLTFLRGSGQKGHQDSAYVPYTSPRQFSASWVALEDVTIGAGELFYYPGSHRFPDFLYGGKYKSIDEAARCCYSVDNAEIERHLAILTRRAESQGIEKKILAAKKGDVLIWHADLVHGGNLISADKTRKSLVTHYCPKRISPLSSELLKTKIYEYQGHIFTSHLYPPKYFVR